MNDYLELDHDVQAIARAISAWRGDDESREHYHDTAELLDMIGDELSLDDVARAELDALSTPSAELVRRITAHSRQWMHLGELAILSEADIDRPRTRTHVCAPCRTVCKHFPD